MKLRKTALLICILIANLHFAKTQTAPVLPSTTLWKISGNGIQEGSYIYLTTANCDSRINLNKKVEKALADVKAIAVESNINSRTNAPRLPLLIAASNDSQRIKNILPPREYSQMINAVKENYGMTEQYLNQFKPRYISALLAMTANPCGTPGAERIEDVLSAYANKKGIGYKELFTPDEVFSECDRYSNAYWRQNFLYLFANADQVKQILQNKNNLYGVENMEGLKHLFTSAPYCKLKYSGVTVQIHNQLLVSKIQALIQAQPSLIAVDIAYWLTSGSSLPQLLAKAGYEISPVTE